MGSKRTRVSPQKVKENAERGSRGQWLNLPDGVESWSPEKEGRYKFDVVPYEVTVDNHPDDVRKGSIWYKREILVHYNVGGTQTSVVCPTCVGQKCPICPDFIRLKKKYGNEPSKSEADAINGLKPKKVLVMNILDPDDHKHRRVFVFGSGKFWSFKGGGLDKELRDPANEQNLSFFDVKGGKTLRVRMSQETFEGGRKFLQASKFEFEPRKDMDEDKTLAASVDLDKAIIVLPFDKLKEMHEMGGDDNSSSSSSSASSSESDAQSSSVSVSASDSGSGNVDSGSASESSATSASESSASESSASASSDSVASSTSEVDKKTSHHRGK